MSAIDTFHWWDVTNEWSFAQALNTAPISDRILVAFGAEPVSKTVIKNPQLLRLQALLDSPQKGTQMAKISDALIGNSVPVSKPEEEKKDPISDPEKKRRAIPARRVQSKL